METKSRRKATTETATVAETLSAITNAPPAVAAPTDAQALHEHVNSLMAKLVDTEKNIANVQATIDDTPIGAHLLMLRKEAEATKEHLKTMTVAFQLTQDVPLETPHGSVGWQKRETKILAPVAVRELAPSIAALVITEVVDNKALVEVIKMCIKRNELPKNTMDLIEQHVMSEKKIVWAFNCKLLNSKKA